MARNPSTPNGFTLIELSIALVIIGLIIGGVLAGQSLIAAAAVRAQITQIEKFNTAANTFFGKYGYLPGDICNPLVNQFGFVPRVNSEGHGDCNGVLEGYSYNLNSAFGWDQDGETVFFWEDLSSAHLIEGQFSTASDSAYATSITSTSTPNFIQRFPQAKIGGGNFVYVYSIGSNGSSNSVNWFGIAVPNGITNTGANLTASPGITVAQAFAIDSKIDDALAPSGRVQASYLNGLAILPPLYQASNANLDSPSTCYNTTTGLYSVSQSAGANVNCALSIRMQAGD